MNRKSSSSSMILKRSRATALALASVRAEGLEPSTATKKRLAQYAEGVITVDQLRTQTLAEATALGVMSRA